MKIKIYEKRRRRTETNAAEDEIGTELSMAVEQSQPDA